MSDVIRTPERFIASLDLAPDARPDEVRAAIVATLPTAEDDAAVIARHFSELRAGPERTAPAAATPEPADPLRELRRCTMTGLGWA
jgi:hypothetical protein